MLHRNFYTPNKYHNQTGPFPTWFVIGYGSVLGTALMVGLMMVLSDPGLWLHDSPKDTGMGVALTFLYHGVPDGVVNAVRYITAGLTVLTTIVLWPFVFAAGSVLGLLLFLLPSVIVGVVFVWPYRAIHEAIFTLPEKRAFDHVPDGFLRHDRLTRFRRGDIAAEMVVSFCVTLLVYFVCLF